MPYVSVPDVLHVWNVHAETAAVINDNTFDHLEHYFQEQHHLRAEFGDAFKHTHLTGQRPRTCPHCTDVTSGSEYERVWRCAKRQYDCLPPGYRPLGEPPNPFFPAPERT